MPTLVTANFSNLRLLDRPDLALTLTKINVWRLTQFRKCVYVDADVLALRAPDELFSLDVDFAVHSFYPKSHIKAAPDVGWPDIFNSVIPALDDFLISGCILIQAKYGYLLCSQNTCR
jgi:glycogenin